MNKSYWEKPEGMTGMLLLGGFGVAAFLGFGLIAPFLTMILGNLILLILTGGSLIALIAFLMNGDIQNVIKQGFMGLTRGISNIFVNVYHIDILKNKVQELYEKLDYIKSIRFKIGNSLGTIRQNKKTTEREFGKAKDQFASAKQRESKSEMFTASRQMERMQKLFKKQEESEKRLAFFVKMLDKYTDMTQAVALDTDNEVKFTIQDYENTKETRNAMRAVKNILMGDESKSMYDKALELTLTKTEEYMGEIDGIIGMATSLVDKFDSESGEFEQKALAMFDNWTKKEDSIILGDNKKLLIDEAKGLSVVDVNESPMETKMATKSASGFDSLYGKK